MKPKVGRNFTSERGGGVKGVGLASTLYSAPQIPSLAGIVQYNLAESVEKVLCQVNTTPLDNTGSMPTVFV